MTLLKVFVLSRFFRKMIKYLKIKVYLTCFTVVVFSGDIKKKKKKNLKMTSQLVIFRAFFFRPPDPESEKKIPVNQLIKKILALSQTY